MTIETNETQAASDLLWIAEQVRECPFCIGQGNILCHAKADGDCTWAKCPQLREYSNNGCPLANWDDEEADVQQCLTCQGSGTVPLVPGLRRDCEGITDWYTNEHKCPCPVNHPQFRNRKYYDPRTTDHDECGETTGWLPLPIPEAARVLVRDKKYPLYLRDYLRELYPSKAWPILEFMEILCDDNRIITLYRRMLES